MAPARQRFSVAIRTAWIDSASGEGEFGIGSGIVWDSEPEAEYAECLAKRDFLLNASEQWGLLEAIPQHALGDEVVVSRHLERLSNSADEFGIAFDAPAVRQALARLAPTRELEHQKVRVKLSLDGTIDVSTGPSSIEGGQVTATLASTPIDSTNPNYRFKTTSRGVYQRHLDAHPEVEEVLLFNERGELTEFCRGNVVLKLDGRLVTPDPAVGCLPGTGVARLVDCGEVSFARPTLDDLRTVDAVYFVNAVVGMVPVALVDSKAALRIPNVVVRKLGVPDEDVRAP
jgi:para-aminobenzoate synthetase/4-amino-4-deoxychorismate lyase